MLGKWITRIVGSKSDRDEKRLLPVVDEINRYYVELHRLSDEELRGKTQEFKARIVEKTGDGSARIRELKETLCAPPSDAHVDLEEVRLRIDELEKEEKEITENVLQEILPEAFAVVKEACRRLLGKSWKVVEHETKWDMVPFDVQLMGAVVLHEGKISEMATGEGKTLVATMPLYLNALVGKGAHLVTVNDYLARRDCEWMGEIYTFLGLSVAYITHDMPPEKRKQAYAADITYGTNNEFGFDYLRDNMTGSMEGVVQRVHYYAIVDEVDSVLIDEARTPLIISGPVGESKNKFAEMKPRVEKLVKSQSVLVNQIIAEGEAFLQEGKEYEAGIKLLQAQRGAPKNKKLTKLLHEPGVQRLIHRVESDYMRDKKLNELDEELFFAIDEKMHTVDLTEKGRETLSPDNPELFILPDLATRLSEIEGNDRLSAAEINKLKHELQGEYGEKSEMLQNISQLLRAYSLFEKDVEYVVTEDGKVMIVDEFTGRLMPGRRFSDGLHQALEAKENVHIERETQTLATITLQNFFRLYKKLAGMTGTAETEAGEFWEIYKLDVVVVPTNEPVRREDRDDVVYRTKREKYNAIIEEIVQCHEMGQPVLVGTVSVDVSETLSRMLRRRGIPHSVLNAKHHRQEAEIITRAGEPGMVTIATNMAGRGTDIKLGAGVIHFSDEALEALAQEAAGAAGKGRILIHELPENETAKVVTLLQEKQQDIGVIGSIEEKDDALFGEGELKHRITVIPRSLGGSSDNRVEKEGWIHIKARDYASGGLHIIGTERHEARRIDRQLRGRAGRQGDPGSSRFYLSLEDDLMRLFGSERIAGIMDRMGLEEGDVITHPMITRSIERAQKRVEMRNFEIRKHLLEYDNVMNKQREVVYGRRRRALQGENLRDEILYMAEEFIADRVSVAMDTGAAEAGWDLEGLRDELYAKLRISLPFSENEIVQLQKEGVTDKLITMTQKEYEENRRLLGDSLMSQVERYATLRTIDERWKEHLYDMDQLKEGIGLRAYGQKDPLLEYKQEAFQTFTEMIAQVNDEILEFVFTKPKEIKQGPEVIVQPVRREPIEMAMVHEDTAGMGFVRRETGEPGAEGAAVAGKKQPIRVEKEKKVGRNDPCWCGSGKKFKHCHGANS